MKQIDNIIFLDIDGVLQINNYSNPWMGKASLLDGYEDRDEYGLVFDYDCVKRLQQLIEATDAAVVISSSWRYSGLAVMLDMWKERQMPGEMLDIISIDDSLEHTSRGENVQEWLKSNSCKCYVIIDDVNDFLESQQSNFIETDYDLGFQK